MDLTLKIQEGSVINHPDHPRAPLLWESQRHDITQYFVKEIWTEENLPLFDGLPKEAGEGGAGHGWASEQIIIGTHMGTHIDAPLHYENDIEQDIASIKPEQTFGEAIILI
ncbi:MAG: cyclase family protein [Actinomycetota bacterium]|nr:cyclase family protein [Actinomycetota bacterium]